MFAIGSDRYTRSTFANVKTVNIHQGKSSLATVVQTKNSDRVSRNFLETVIEEFNSTDDVFRQEFLQGVIFTTTEDSHEDLVTHDAIALLKSYKNEWIEILYGKHADEVPSPGVYMATEGMLFEVYKLYDDTHGAFLTSLIRTNDGAHVPFTLAGTEPNFDLVCMPTRIRPNHTGENVLQGLRIAIKGNFHIRGVRTSACNRAYFNTYSAQNHTAKSITELEEKGARIVGVTKLAAFAATEEPMECVDYQAPWNPRGDMHQFPAGSSSGSGVAVASYEWLDIGIGTDSKYYISKIESRQLNVDSQRKWTKTGALERLFAHRPTHGLVDLDGIIPSFSQFDTATIFARSVHLCTDFVGAWYGDKLPTVSEDLPFKIVVPEDYMKLIINLDQRRLIDKFVTDLESFLDTSRENMSLEATWNKSPPQAASGQSFADYMKYAARDAFFYDDYHHLDSFRTDYMSKFSKTPYISPPVRWQWNLSATITREDRDEAVDRLAVYKDWFLNQIMEVNKRQTIMIIPIENIAPRYRDEAKTTFNPAGVPMLFLSPISGGPESTVPIGEVQYMSRVSNRLEPQPVAVSLLSLPGTDLNLLKPIAGCLHKSGRPTHVKVGRSMF